MLGKPWKSRVENRSIFGCKWQDQKRTEDRESENHVVHDFITKSAACALIQVHTGLQVTLIHPDLHLLLHFVGTERTTERRKSGINYWDWVFFVCKELYLLIDACHHYCDTNSKVYA